MSAPDKPTLVSKVATSQKKSKPALTEQVCEWRILSERLHNAHDPFPLTAGEGCALDMAQTYSELQGRRTFELTEGERAQYGMSEQLSSRWLEPYRGCWRSAGDLARVGDVAREENPELTRKLGHYRVP